MTENLSTATDSEECVIGSCLVNRHAAEAALRLLTPEDFGSPHLAAAFGAIAALHDRGSAIDSTTLLAELRRNRTIWDEAQADILHWSVDVPYATHVVAYAETVAHHSAKRKLVRIGADLANRAQDPTTTPADLADQTVAQIVELDSPSLAQSPGDLSVDEFLAEPEDTLAPVVIPNLLTLDDRVIIVAPEGVGKSFWLRMLVVLPAWGIHPLTFKPMPAVPTLLVDLENPRALVRSALTDLSGSCRRHCKGERASGSVWLRPGGLDLRRRADRVAFEDVLRRRRPALVAFGPVYKAYQRRASESDEQVASEVQAIIDDLRTRYGFALIMEHHAPQSNGGLRDLRPFGSSLWLRWPEFGINLKPDKDRKNELLHVGRWRGDRVQVGWPDRLERGSPWPWVPRWDKDGSAF